MINHLNLLFARNNELDSHPVTVTNLLSLANINKVVRLGESLEFNQRFYPTISKWRQDLEINLL